MIEEHFFARDAVDVARALIGVEFHIHGTGGIIRSFVVALVMIIIAGLLERKRIRLKV